MRTGRGRSSRTRRTGTRERHIRALIVCGGIKTEPEYLEYIRTTLNASGIAIEIAKLGESPRALLNRAEELINQDRRNAKKNHDASNVYDSAWIVTDVDEYREELITILPEAKSKKIQVAISNPCFELWLLWHVADCGWETTKGVQAKAVKAGVVSGKKGKTVEINKIEGQYRLARKRSLHNRKTHVANGARLLEDNPSSAMDVLIDSLINAAQRARPGVEILL